MSDGTEAIQDEIIAFLMLGESYSLPAATVKRIDTHAAIIFLAGNRAYKLKRSLRLPYLDFSTVEKRRRICEREVELNRATAPGLYLGVVPIVRSAAGQLNIGGEGPALDWLIEMARFEENALLDRLAAMEKLDIRLIVSLAEVIARFHEAAPIHTNSGWLDSLNAIADNISAAFHRAESKEIGIAAEDYLQSLRARIREQSPLLARREEQGYVRRCHGDLHLKNIVLIEGEPVPFDALEFDEQLATIDILYDLAFLSMDLWQRGLHGHANTLLNNYFYRSKTPDALEGLAAMPFFMSLRAAIRAMVGLDALPFLERESRQRMLRGVRCYYDLANKLIEKKPPCLIAVGGYSGAGKSTLATGLSPKIGAPPGALHVRTDVERKLMLGVALERRLAPERYTAEAMETVYDRLFTKAKTALKAGQAVIVDATFLLPEHRAKVERLAADSGVRFFGLWLQADTDELYRRVAKRTGDASDAGAAVVTGQLDTQAAAPDWLVVDAGGSPVNVREAAEKRLLEASGSACGGTALPML